MGNFSSLLTMGYIPSPTVRPAVVTITITQSIHGELRSSFILRQRQHVRLSFHHSDVKRLVGLDTRWSSSFARGSLRVGSMETVGFYGWFMKPLVFMDGFPTRFINQRLTNNDFNGLSKLGQFHGLTHIVRWPLGPNAAPSFSRLVVQCAHLHPSPSAIKQWAINVM